MFIRNDIIRLYKLGGAAAIAVLIGSSSLTRQQSH